MTRAHAYVGAVECGAAGFKARCKCGYETFLFSSKTNAQAALVTHIDIANGNTGSAPAGSGESVRRAIDTVSTNLT